MSNEEQEWHKAKGLCFICHKPGHFSRNCPDRNDVMSMESNKPPGMESFGINVNFGDLENQHKLSEHLQDHGLAMNNIHIPGGMMNPMTCLGSQPVILKWSDFSIAEWYLDEIGLSCVEPLQDEITHTNIECNKASPSDGSYSPLECDAAIMRDTTWAIPKPVTDIVHVNRQPAHVLVDTGSLVNFMSLNLAE